MGISFNQKQVASIDQLAAFIDFLQNPTKFSSLLADLKIAKADLEKSMDRFSKFKSAEDYIQAEEKDLDAFEASLQTRDSALADAEVAFAKDKAQQETEYLEKQATLSSTEEKLKADIADFEKQKIALQEIASRAGDIRALERDVAARELALANKEKELAEKADKIKALLG